MLSRRLILALAGALCLAAGEAPLTGMWGADGALLALDAQGGRLQIDCRIAHFGPVQPDAQGKFDLPAQVESVSVMLPEDDEADPPASPATLSGHMLAGSMDVTLVIQGQPPRRLQLKLGQSGKLPRCLQDQAKG